MKKNNKKLDFPVIIDTEKCKGCELCIYYCPKKCLGKSEEINKLGYTYAVLTKPEECNSCGTCYIMCPEYIITVFRFEKTPVAIGNKK